MIETQAQTSWRQLTERLRAFVARRVASADVDDVVQDTLLRVRRGLADLVDEERFGPWVYRVTRSAIADHLRARARADREGAVPVDEDLEAPAAADDDGLGSALVGCLSRFVADLPSPYREAITLTELEGLSQKEAAELLGLSHSGMKSRVQRGRERLRSMFDDCCALSLDARGHVFECEPHSTCETSTEGDLAWPRGSPSGPSLRRA